MGAARSFLTTYRPLCRTRTGRQAIARHGLAPYVDGSCRREPDFESSYPAITALCRGRMFAPRLREGDRVAYVTKKGHYGGSAAHWRLVALLDVRHAFRSHEAAANWYRERGLSIPRNCIVSDTRPVALDETDGVMPAALRRHQDVLSPERILSLWDKQYQARAEANPGVLVCEPIWVDVTNPPEIHESDWLEWVGRVPATRTPPAISAELWAKLEQVAQTTRGR
ncbi:MAG TPA: hypothetical protein VGF28_15510 [Thermoanaerobaculia bacterium]|jgi:hypothetical protein